MYRIEPSHEGFNTLAAEIKASASLIIHIWSNVNLNPRLPCISSTTVVFTLSVNMCCKQAAFYYNFLWYTGSATSCQCMET